MKNSLFIIIFIGIFLVIKTLPYELTVQEVSTLLVGVMLLTSYLFSDIIKKYNLPKITGYMIMGVILGPSGLQFINNDIIDNLQFLENLALSFIALAAGGELKFSILKNYKKSLSLILISQLFIIFFGIVILFSIIAQFLPFLSGLSNSIIIGFAILFAGTALSTSPATAIGIITEVEAKGKITNIILAITVLKAIF